MGLGFVQNSPQNIRECTNIFYSAANSLLHRTRALRSACGRRIQVVTTGQHLSLSLKSSPSRGGFGPSPLNTRFVGSTHTSLYRQMASRSGQPSLAKLTHPCDQHTAPCDICGSRPHLHLCTACRRCGLIMLIAIKKNRSFHGPFCTTSIVSRYQKGNLFWTIMKQDMMGLERGANDWLVVHSIQCCVNPSSPVLLFSRNIYFSATINVHIDHLSLHFYRPFAVLPPNQQCENTKGN